MEREWKGGRWIVKAKSSIERFKLVLFEKRWEHKWSCPENADEVKYKRILSDRVEFGRPRPAPHWYVQLAEDVCVLCPFNIAG